VVALSDSDADTVQTYEYSVYGQVAASDPNFLTNPYMFTGRRFDLETGLYFYRARYYNPHIGRFMQTDPVGYADGMNWYAYCGNNPICRTDPSGLYYELYNIDGKLTFGEFHDCSGDLISVLWEGESLDAWYEWAENENVLFDSQWMYSQPAFQLWINSPQGQDSSRGIGYNERLFWEIQALIYLGIITEGAVEELGFDGVKIVLNSQEDDHYDNVGNIIYWDPSSERMPGLSQDWSWAPSLAFLYHEMYHAYVRNVYVTDKHYTVEQFLALNVNWQFYAIAAENRARHFFWCVVPGWEGVYPRPDDSEPLAPSFGVDNWIVWQYYPWLPGRNITWYQPPKPY
jgi:RHS repeat-associated protein